MTDRTALAWALYLAATALGLALSAGALELMWGVL